MMTFLTFLFVILSYFSNALNCRHREALRKGKVVNVKVFNFYVIIL